ILLEYVFLKMQGELPYNYTMTVANNWVEKGYQSAEDAVESIKEYQEHQEKRKTRYLPSERQGEQAPKSTSKGKPPAKKDKDPVKIEKERTNQTNKTAKEDPELQKMIKDFRKNR